MTFLKMLPVATVLSLGLQAQTTPDDAEKADIQQMKQEIADLQSKLAQQEKRLSSPDGSPGSSVPEAPLSAAEASTAASQTDATAAPPEPVSHGLQTIVFHGVGDLNFGRPVFSVLPPGGLPTSTNSFGLGDLDLYTSAALSERLSFFAEVLVTSDFTNQFSAELDRMMLAYKFNEYLKLTAGKFNTALGYYSNAFNRARYFQTTTGRPLMFTDEDDGGILPVHSIGVSATGLIPSGKLGLHWVAEVSNGRSFQPGAEPIQNFVDMSNGKAVNFGAFIRPEWLDGVEVGSDMYREEVYLSGLPKIAQTINSFYAVYVTPRVEFMNEAAIVRDSLFGTGRTPRSLTGYSQLSRKWGSWRPYVRYDYQSTAAADPLFGYLGRLDGPSVGIRYQIAQFAGLKLQYGRLWSSTTPAAGDVQVQIAFAF
jgi:hypothetical protein